MTVTLDDQAEIEKKDSGKMLATIRLLPDQMEQAWEEVGKIDFPDSYKHCDNVVFCGMGGSTLAGRIVDSLLVNKVRVPIEINNHYDIPHYVNEKTLVFSSSYSGNTEEAVSAYENSVEAGAKIFVVTTGGKLAKKAKTEKTPAYVFEPKANLSGQPRMGLGYSIVSELKFLSMCGYLKLSDDDFYEIATQARNFTKEFDVDIASTHNLAKSIAHKLHGSASILIASEHLTGVAHAFKNQLNENSKNFSVLFDIPELNHHLLEGLKKPEKLRGLLTFLMLESDFYHKRVQPRYKLTAEVIEKNGHKCIHYKPRSTSQITQIFEVLTLGSFVSFYLAMLNHVDPTPIPWVDYFKEKLA